MEYHSARKKGSESTPAWMKFEALIPTADARHKGTKPVPGHMPQAGVVMGWRLQQPLEGKDFQYTTRGGWWG